METLIESVVGLGFGAYGDFFGGEVLEKYNND